MIARSLLPRTVKPSERKRPYEWYFLRRPHPLHDQYIIVPRTKWGVLALPGIRSALWTATSSNRVRPNLASQL